MEKTAYELLLERKVARLEEEVHQLRSLKGAEPYVSYDAIDDPLEIRSPYFPETMQIALQGGWRQEYMMPGAEIWARIHVKPDGNDRIRDGQQWALYLRESEIGQLKGYWPLVNYAQVILKKSIESMIRSFIQD